MTTASAPLTSAAPVAGGLSVGVGKTDITPDEPVSLVGNSSAVQSEEVDTKLYVKAMVISDGTEKAAIVTIDTLKYPSPEEAIRRISVEAGIPAGNIVISASHTHSAPYYTYYYDNLVDSIVDAVKSAVEDLEPCSIGAADTQISDISHNRRLVKDDDCWNDWLLSNTSEYVPAGPTDPELQVLAAMNGDGKYKAILWNYACHPNANGEAKISADYPGHAQQSINDLLGYETTALFLPGAAGDVNPNVSPSALGEAVAKGIVDSLKEVEYMEGPGISAGSVEIQLPGRPDPVFAEQEISLKWPSELESYRSNFNNTLQYAKTEYKALISGICIGDDFAIVSNPGELFCALGLEIKANSPFARTMVAEASNGFLGYMPTQNDFAVKGYETWYGEHSFLAVGAGETVRDESVKLLRSFGGDTSGLLTDLQVSVYKVVDGSNVILQFDKDAAGLTDLPNYEVKDAAGNAVEISSVSSAFAELGGEAANVFKLTLASPLAAGTYTVTASNIRTLSGPAGTYTPVSASLTVTAQDAAASASGDGKEQEGLQMSVYKVLDSSNVVVQFNKEATGFTDAPNYEVKSKSGAVQKIKSVSSAFAELGGEAANVFKLTFASPLPAGTYTIKASNMTSSAQPSETYSAVSATLTLKESTSTATTTTTTGSTSADGGTAGLKMTLYKVLDSSNVVVRFDKEAFGCTDAPNYVVKNKAGEVQKITAVVSAFAELGGEAANVFKITFATPLSAGSYTVTASNLTKSATAPSSTYSPVSAELTVKEGTSSGTSTTTSSSSAGVELTGLKVIVYKVVDSSSVILQFNMDVFGCTDAPNYVVKNAAGEVQKVKAVTSAFAELKGEAPNVFKITFSSPLAAGTYTVTASNMVDSPSGQSKTYAPATVTLTIE